MHVFIQSIIGQILFGSYIAFRGGQAIPSSKLRKAFYGLLLAEFLFFLVGFSFRSVLSKEAMAVMINVTGTWYFASIYISMAIFAVNLVRRMAKKRFQRMEEQCYCRLKAFLFVAIAIGTSLLIVKGYFNVLHPIVRHYTVRLNKPLGNGQKRIRLLFMSDLHFSEAVTGRYARNIVELSNRQQADILLVGGDIFDYWADFGYRDSIPQRMASIDAPLGKYYVMGNHDYRANVAEKKAWVSLVDGILLIDSIAYPKQVPFVLIGRDDATQKKRSSLKGLTQQIDSIYASFPRVLLEHQPVELDSLPVHGVDLALYGHTHNGQVWPFGWLVRLAFEKTWGYLNKKGTHIVVSSGAGAAGPAIRIGTRSELVVIDLIGG